MPKVIVNTSDGALIQFTGGTTGLPKGALLSHSNIVAVSSNAPSGVTPLLFTFPTPDVRVISVIPYFHISAILLP